MFWRLGIALIVLGGVVGYFGVQELRLAAAASPTPEAISLKELIDRGPDGNAHVSLRDYDLLEDELVPSDDSDKIYVPVVPAGSAAEGKVQPGDIKAIIVSSHVPDADDLHLLAPPLKGMVVNWIDPISSDDRDLLKENLPGIDLKNCVIIEEGRAPKGAAHLLLFGVGCVGLVGLGAVLIVGGLIRR
jgi:hypothetical protein